MKRHIEYTEDAAVEITSGEQRNVIISGKAVMLPDDPKAIAQHIRSRRRTRTPGQALRAKIGADLKRRVGH